ncbi:PQQ-binding-like beta-propeller repeat protein [Thalassoglobus sp.]|uniref:outer membrane protein assembly factor BamB family protein n=1 Tax=Thalassoglobus sp. TaxID=2795869 RepID=UPI003AA8DED8
MQLRFAVFALFMGSSVLVAEAAEISQFRGSRGDGISVGTQPPVEFSELKNLSWKTPIPGKGWSSPVIADGKLWLTTAIEVFPDESEREKLLLEAGDEPRKFHEKQIAKSITLKLVTVNLNSGKLDEMIDLVHVEKPDSIHRMNSYASPTPFIDGKYIYCHFGTYGTFCIDRNSLSIVWKNQIPQNHSVGPGSSPFIYKNLLILICDGVDKQYVMALDKTTGETVWKTDRPEMDAPDGNRKKSFDTPIYVKDRLGREQLICMGSQWVVAYEPKTGNEIWKVSHGKGFSVVPRPVVGNGMVYISTGFGKAQLWAIRIDGTGDVSETHVAWVEKRNIPTQPSPLLINDRLYVMGDTGIATCFDAIDGTTVWAKRVGGNYVASPLFANGKIYFANQEGIVKVIEPNDTYKEVASNQISGQIKATPVAIENALIIRTEQKLYRFETESASAKKNVSVEN